MGARRLLLATVFSLGFCFATGCALQRGTPARYLPTTASLDQIKSVEASLKKTDLPSEEPLALNPPEQSPTQDQIIAPPMIVNKKTELPKPETANTSSRSDNQTPPKKNQTESPIVFQRSPGPRADDRLLDLVEKDLEKAFELPVERRRLEFSKDVTEHSRVRYFIGYFSRTQKHHFAKALSRSGRYFPMMAKVLREAGLPEELAYLALIESNFQPHAASSSGAVGLWQFVPETARRYGLRINAWVDERRDPVKSTRAAAAYLKELHDYFGRWYLATAAYNAGQGTIQKAMKNSGAKDFWSLSEKSQLSDETRNFVPKFVAAALIATNPQKYGFGGVGYEAPLEYDEVEVRGNLELAWLADTGGTDVQTIKDLNPELLQTNTPPGERFRLKLPAGQGVLVQRMQQEQKENEPSELVMHEVKKGETLFSIARRYGQEVRSLMELNGLTTSTLRVGQKLKVLLESLRGTLR